MIRHEQNNVPVLYKNANGSCVQVEETRIAVVMVGLPARGKSLIAQKGTLPHHLRAPNHIKANTDPPSGPLPRLAFYSCKMFQCRLLSSP